MKNNRKFFAIALISAMAFAGCEKWEIEVVQDMANPIGYTITGASTALVIFDNEDITDQVTHSLDLEAADTVRLSGNTAISATGANKVEAAETVVFTNNYCGNNVAVKGLTLRYPYNGKVYELQLISSDRELLKVSRNLTTIKDEESEKVAKDDYVLVFGEMLLASDATVFVASENATPGAVTPVYFETTNTPGIVTVTLSDSSKVQNVEHSFALSTQAEYRFTGTSACVCTGNSSITAANTVTFQYNYCTNDVAVSGLTMEYGGEVVNGQIVERRTIQCRSSLTVKATMALEEESTNPYHSVSQATYSLQNASVSLATAQTRFVVDEGYVPPTVVEVQHEHSHINFNSVANWANASTIIVTGNHQIKFWQLMSDGSRQNEEAKNYRVKYTFQVTGYNGTITVDNLATAIRTYSFSGNTITIGDATISVTLSGTEFVGNVNYQGSSYNQLRQACQVRATKLDVTSATAGTLTFDDANSNNDKATAQMDLNLQQRVTQTGITATFEHISFGNPIVNGPNFSIPCANRGWFTRTYSDGTQGNPESLPVNITNNYSVSGLSFVVSDASTIIGQTFNFTNGTAFVVYQNVTVHHTGRNFPNVVFDGQNFTAQAQSELDCQPVPVSIEFISGNSAELTLVEDGESITVTVPVTITVAEIISGTIMMGSLTDGYQSQIGSQARTDLHILASNNGTYTVYSRQSPSDAWTTTNISATEANSITTSGREIAWIWNYAQNAWQLGTVSVLPRANEEDRYVLEYYTLSGVLAYRLGINNETIGQPWRHAIRGRLVQNYSTGMWNLTYLNGQSGTEQIFVGQ